MQGGVQNPDLVFPTSRPVSEKCLLSIHWQQQHPLIRWCNYTAMPSLKKSHVIYKKPGVERRPLCLQRDCTALDSAGSFIAPCVWCSYLKITRVGNVSAWVDPLILTFCPCMTHQLPGGNFDFRVWWLKSNTIVSSCRGIFIKSGAFIGAITVSHVTVLPQGCKQNVAIVFF